MFRRPTGQAFGVSLTSDRATAAADAAAPPLPASARRAAPAAADRAAFLALVDAHAAVVVVGDAGCGKTTAIPSFLAEAGWSGGGLMVLVAAASPRAALLAAHAAADAAGEAVGAGVGYAVAYEDVCTPGTTRLKYVTHDALLAAIGADPLLSAAAAVVVDDADARSSPAADAALALLPRIAARRPDLRVVLTASDPDAAAGLAAWWDAAAASGGQATSRDPAAAASRTAALLTVGGAAHAVRLQYLAKPAPSYVAAAADAVAALHEGGVPGDVCVFVPTAAAARAVAAALDSRRLGPSGGRRLEVVQLVTDADDARDAAAALAAAAAAAPRGVRRALTTTDAAVAGVGLPSVAAVVDSLLTCRRGVDAATGLPWATVGPVSRAEAAARAARAGRSRPGVCVRLATEADAAAAMPAAPPPPLATADAAPLLLTLASFGLASPLALPWPAPPPPAAVARGLETLFALGAIDGNGRLTPAGGRMAELPLTPPLARALLAGGDAGVAADVATVAAMASVRSVWSTAAAKAAEAEFAAAVAAAGGGGTPRKRSLADWQAPFAAAEGDPLTWTNVWAAYRAAGRRGAWAAGAGLDARALARAADVRKQIVAHARRVGVPVDESDDDNKHKRPTRSDGAALVRALASGLFASAAARAAECDADGAPLYAPLAPPRADGAPHPRLRLVKPCVLAGVAHPPDVIVVLVADAAPSGGAVGVRAALAVDPGLLRDVAPHYFQ